MANVILDDTHLTNIANAIREKNGEATTYTPGAMAKAITDLPSGGSVEVEPIVLTGDCKYAGSGAMAASYIKLFGDTVSTKDITSAANMFAYCQNEIIPFEINMKSGSYQDMSNMFTYSKLKELPIINHAYPSSLSSFLGGANKLIYIPDDYFDDWDFSRMQSYAYASFGGLFESDYLLRRVPSSLLKQAWGIQTMSSYMVYNRSFNNCYTLDEIKGLAVHNAVALTSNAFSSMVDNCSRLKDLIFDVNEDGSAKTANWKSQTINLSNGVGNTTTSYNITYILQSGITADKEIKDDATYQALKNDADSFTTWGKYSRYNHDSAVNTINSLPDTSAYLATAGGTNTIKFKGTAGASTDGGAINTLTEEEIAVATAKGWTVSLV